MGIGAYGRVIRHVDTGLGVTFLMSINFSPQYHVLLGRHRAVPRNERKTGLTDDDGSISRCLTRADSYTKNL